MSSSFYSSSEARRRVAPTPKDPVISGVPQPVTDPNPNPQPVFKFLALGSILLLGLLQFLPATHFRHPSDRLRNWFPIETQPSSTFSVAKSEDSTDGNSSFVTASDGDDGMVHIVSWMDCRDLQLLAVLANSTLSSSRYPELIFFHFFIPNGNEDKVSFFKLKVLFPHSNLEIHGQEEVKQTVNNAMSGTDYSSFNFEEIAPFVLPIVKPMLKKFIYVSPNVIMKGRVEELIGIDLSNYAIGAAKNCAKRLDALVNTDVLDAIQRSASKPWVSETPYMKNACVPNLNVLLIDARKLEGDFLQAVLWWSKVLNWSERSGKENPAVALTLYNRYLKLSSPWLVRDTASSEIINESLVICYDGPKRDCSKSGSANQRTGYGNTWKQYVPLTSDRILGD